MHRVGILIAILAATLGGCGSCHTACFPAEWVQTMRYYDLTTKKQVLSLETKGTIAGFQASPVVPSVDTRLFDDHVEVLGCNEQFPL